MLLGMRKPVLAGCVFLLCLGCEERSSGRDQPTTAASTPDLVAAGGGGGADTLGSDLAELGASANRKLHHDDGKGCLEDLDKIKAKAPKLAKTMTALRAQCQMLNGECQAGKRLLAGYYMRELNMTPERAESTAESIGSMRCRGADMTDRDRMLRALWEISDGAFMNQRSDCEKNIAIVRELRDKVLPDGPDDGQIKGGPRAVFHNGAACLARAKDCAGAWRVWQDNYPADAMRTLSEAQRREVIESGFRSSIERCKDEPLAGTSPPKSGPRPPAKPGAAAPAKPTGGAGPLNARQAP
jgi:hypothetical protein